MDEIFFFKLFCWLILTNQVLNFKPLSQDVKFSLFIMIEINEIHLSSTIAPELGVKILKMLKEFCPLISQSVHIYFSYWLFLWYERPFEIPLC